MNIAVVDAVKTIGSDRVLDGVNLRIPAGSIVGLRGPNGSGKTMLMRAICGFIRLDGGFVEVDGRRIGRDIEFPDRTGLLLERPAYVADKSAAWNARQLAAIRAVATREDIEDALSRVGLGSVGGKRVRGFSLGMKQRLGIAMAIMEHPELLVLDEPSNGLDDTGLEMLYRIIEEERSRGATVIVSSHDQEMLAGCADVTYFMRMGALVGEER